jgi:hypothetical protein
MDIRNVQKTGNMFYAYLPTSWCRKHGVNSSSKISLMTNSDGSLSIFPQITEKRVTSINIDLAEDDQSIINKMLVAAYINPTSSFKISLTKAVDIQKLLDQKKLISLEMVEFDGKHISCESSIAIEDPLFLLKTMVRKVKNMLSVMRKDYDSQLMDIYEDEIDRSKLLIEKSVISRLTFNEPSPIKIVFLHYITLISKDLEKAVDQLPAIDRKEKAFLESVGECIGVLLQVLEKIVSTNRARIDHKDVIAFTKKVDSLRPGTVTSMNSYNKLLAKQMLTNISEVLFDWSISYMVEEKQEHQLSGKA